MIESIKNWDLRVLLKLNHAFANWGFLNKFFAEYLTYSLPIILVVLWFWSKEAKKVALRAGFAVILAWPILAASIGHFIHRARPFDSGGVQELVFHRPSVSFPSDHAATLFAVAMSFYFSGYKKLSYGMFAVAIVICFFRVATGIHWPTDIFAGIVVGIFSAWFIKLLDPYMDVVYNWIINLLKKVKLA